ncbi:hypothetical protein Tco_0875118 [Tanacetum coccineum]|uniref:Uncharacterized protein n=1 Tax=Tanacetum coccineum TaxID=301880 RepID=A0ABQ5BRD8_9ASTR
MVELLCYGPNEVDLEQGMEELLYYDIDDGASINGKEGDLETWFSDEEVDQDIYVEWQYDPYRLVDELKESEEISDMFAKLNQAMDELDQVIEVEDVMSLSFLCVICFVIIDYSILTLWECEYAPPTYTALSYSLAARKELTKSVHELQVNTPLVSPFPQSDKDSDDDEVLNELSTDSVRESNGSGTEALKIDEERDPGRTPESRPPPDDEKMEEDQAGSDPGKSHVALAGPSPKLMHDDFIATVYLNIHESLKLPGDEHVILEDLLSSSGTLSSMKNLDDAYTYRDQFLNDKSTEDELVKLNIEVEVVSMVTVPIYQDDTLVPPLSTLVIEISSPISSSPPVYIPIITATAVTTSTTLTSSTIALPPPLPTQSSTDPKLVARVSTLEKRNA